MKKIPVFAISLNLALLLITVLSAPARAEPIPGHLDTGFDPGVGPNGDVYAVAVQPDGKVIIGGDFTTVDGASRNHIARLNGDGSPDTFFDAGNGPNSRVSAVAMQPDGKVIIGGTFTTVNGVSRNYITRLNSNGSPDDYFDAGTGTNNDVYAVAVQPDGKIIIGGSFTTVDGVSRNHIARLNSNGSVDTSFDPGTNDIVRSVAVQPDGKVIIGGSFTTVNGVSRNYIARLNSNGSLDTSFDPGTGTSHSIMAVAVQTDGKILIGGVFITVDGVSRNYIARLNSNGSLDASFDPGTGASSTVRCLTVENSGKIIIGGNFTTVNGVSRYYIARLNSNGSVDTSFDPGTVGFRIYTLAAQSDGKVIIGGGFTTVNGVSRNHIARLNSNGSLNVGLAPVVNNAVQALARQPDGKILIGGNFTMVNATGRNHIARLNTDGSLDTAFNPGTGASSTVQCLAIQTDGKVLIGGNFTTVDGVSHNRIARLNADGSVDTTGFVHSAGADGTVYAVAIQTGGKFLIGGVFNKVNGTTRNHIARFEANGSLDTTFNPGTDDTVYDVAVQADGKILIGGSFTTVAGISRKYVARLKSNGQLDIGFDPGTGPNSWVAAVMVQSEGKVIIGGDFTTVDGIAHGHIARLNADGSLDTAFNTSTGANNIVYDVAPQPDGKVIVGGSFTTVDAVTNSYIARLNGDRTLYISKNGLFNNTFICYSIISAAFDAARDGDLIKVGQGDYNESTSIATTGTVTVSGGWDETFSSQTSNTTSIRAPSVSSLTTLRLQMLRVIP